MRKPRIEGSLNLNISRIVEVHIELFDAVNFPRAKHNYDYELQIWLQPAVSNLCV